MNAYRLYPLLASKNKLLAYQTLINEINYRQFKLILKDPSNRLLNLITIDPIGVLSISDDFQSIMQTYENSPVTKERDDWKDLGFYIDVLRKEILSK